MLLDPGDDSSVPSISCGQLGTSILEMDNSRWITPAVRLSGNYLCIDAIAGKHRLDSIYVIPLINPGSVKTSAEEVTGEAVVMNNSINTIDTWTWVASSCDSTLGP